MKKVIRLLYREPDADVSRFPPAYVQAAMEVLNERLDEEIVTPYRWFAVCTVAVEAGRWGGERRRRRRLKLLRMINSCRRASGMNEVVMESDRWARTNLYYGYWAIREYEEDHNLPALTLLGELRRSYD